MTHLPERVRLVILDLDGVVYRGREPVPGASGLVAWLQGRGVGVRFATNNSTITRAGYVDRLGTMGIHTAVDEIVTSTTATVAHLARHLPSVRRVLGIGADGMRQELASAGFEVAMARDLVGTIAPGAPITGFDAVIVGLDQHVDYARLAVAVAAVTGGAALIATNADARYPTEAGFLPGAGSIVAAIAAATGFTPEIIGKPSPAMFTAVIEASGIGADQTVVIGDNPEADIAAANRAGLASILVLTGVADANRAASLRGELAPSAVANDPDAIRDLLAGCVN